MLQKIKIIYIEFIYGNSSSKGILRDKNESCCQSIKTDDNVCCDKSEIKSELQPELSLNKLYIETGKLN